MNQRLSWLGLAVVLVVSSGCGDDPVQQSGGPQGGAGGDDIAFCAALQVLRDKCQRCHQDPPMNGAPAPLVTYDDTQADYFDTGRAWWEAMQEAVTSESMPPTSLNTGSNPIMPPIEPLTEEEKATLLGWFEQGALPTGGQSCP